jgi:hypothetical protein
VRQPTKESPMSEWRPAMSTRNYARQPEVGSLIGHAHRVWRVTGIEWQNPGDWSERAREQWMQTGMRDPWDRAPFRVLVKKPGGGGRQHSMLVEPWHYTSWHLMPEDFAVCVKCGDPAPCREYEQAKQAEREMAKAAEEMALPDGCCPACREPISTRQKTHRFPGPNLLNPLGLGDVEFHTRRKCHHGAARYEEMWVAADPTRERSLLTLKCSGHIVTHGDGSAECVGRSGEDCPNIYARHSVYSACWTQSHGCPRLDCQGRRHGCTPIKGLRADGSLR